MPNPMNAAQVDPMAARLLGLQSGAGLAGRQSQPLAQLPMGNSPNTRGLLQALASRGSAPGLNAPRGTGSFGNLGGRMPPLTGARALPSQGALAQAMANIQAAQQASRQGNVAPLGRFGAIGAGQRR